ncbi:hypothetical protein SPRG_13378 [Saprolegnia parasitica CBS 223.65]|uniref:Uncharacterized protein n=1 Tax=Saprolegnia parasitica (strain CBS 223.65) TaxID=695850 RepID=A0A067C439_SAPPC|nr:hypothetical protein SPRG_13378 [Saprolegnia parasitica CBS 223.65]KDO21567.1 hypothetical protein SPRG_13378 [Saprolegnia parasitica CBS 223.65]|eukprot:XP_012207744.1 hypothetical protein SPRG_13378 [Saprolegnia parasitica CBS 223.65]
MVRLVCFGAGEDGWVRRATCPHGVALAPTSAGWTLLVPSTVPPLCHVDACTNGCDPTNPASWPRPARSVACAQRPDSAITLAAATDGTIVGIMPTTSSILRQLAATDAPLSSSPVVLVAVAVVAVTILAVVAVVGSRCDRRPCRKPRPDVVVVVVGSPTAPASWFHLYQNDTGLPHSILTDDDCTTMILRSSRPSPKDHMGPGSYAMDEQSISDVSIASVHGWQTPDGSSNSYATVDASFLSLSHALDDEYDDDARASRLSER